MLTRWEEYLQRSHAEIAGRECVSRCRNSFDQQRKNIQRVVEAIEPRVVACLGAGVLNDIPYRALVRSGAAIHLVDWTPGIIESGLSLSIVSTEPNGQPSCLYCDSAVDCPLSYCRNYRRPRDSAVRVCDSFAATSRASPGCLAFDRGENPDLLRDDATGGYAHAFACRVNDALRNVHSWRRALTRASELARRARRVRSGISIPDSSVDLVTSSMVISQFEHEPYTYFSRQAAQVLGAPTTREEKRLRGALENLRSALVSTQVERHCKEIRRILAPEGRCYFSFEIFHRSAPGDQWFLVPEMHAAMRLLARYFDFTFDIIGEEQTVTKFEVGSGSSLVYSFVVRSRGAGLPSGRGDRSPPLR